MRLFTRIGFGLLVAALLVAACGGETEASVTTTVGTAAATTSPEATTTTSGGPAASATTATTASEMLPPTVEIAWFGVSSDEEFPVFRFLAYVANPNGFPLEGVVVHWEALDKDGVIVGDFQHRFPIIDANFSFPYVGGAGALNLSGLPSSVQIFLDDEGQFAEGAASPMLEVSDVELGPRNSIGAYEPTAVVEAPDHQVSGTQIEIVWVFFDVSGEVIGADFGTFTSIPDTIRPGTKFRVDNLEDTDPRDSLFTGEPTSVGVFAYEDVW
jgi:hypothetical protein